MAYKLKKRKKEFTNAQWRTNRKKRKTKFTYVNGVQIETKRKSRKRVTVEMYEKKLEDKLESLALRKLQFMDQ